ncbi:zonular occludens toxin domain-containing protein [Thauera sp. Sel9]|uniref:zonular occludens toxin domain-containing protein n=1 Tax=Thauera sp. Sel9 TaxID=2974299 RepID=UPI0021E17784|nr:zonular occludens toxin domain-containing protein [Thauera sp. Sel9]MCV2216869.1 zonular occludens toxin domain-containing protein [Thauera sp. Sel9]
MIYLNTGLPGAGKTLYTLDTVRDRAIKEQRTVYYHGIEILKPELYEGWIELQDPTKWYECPDGAIIVHDECQGIYRTRGAGAQVPKHVAEFETHRHRGFDIYLVTQAPTLIDSNVRRLTGQHRHLVVGMAPKVSTVHFWAQVKEDCHKSRTGSERSSFVHPAKIIGSYKSATIHTHKSRVPKAAIFLALVPLILLVAGYLLYSWISGVRGGDDQAVPDSVAVERPQLREQRRDPEPPPDPLAAWIEARVPRIPGLPHTAPIYDEVTRPTTAPVPAACIEWRGKGCRCFTQQGTRMDVPESMCVEFVERGYFVDFDVARRDSHEKSSGS